MDGFFLCVCLYVLYMYVPNCSDDSRERMNREYMSDPNYNFETVNHASKACGPLVMWSVAQVSGAHYLHVNVPWALLHG